jgi:hypothetical protein
VFNTTWVTVLQEQVPAEKLSRVTSYDALGSFVFIPLGLSIAGPVADAIGLTHALWLGSAVVATAMASTLAVPEVRELRRRDEAAVPAPAVVREEGSRRS